MKHDAMKYEAGLSLGAAVTGIGSLPHTEAPEAVKFVEELCPQIPFWPQLPNRRPDEGMICQTLGARRRLFDLCGNGLHDLKKVKLKEFEAMLQETGPKLERELAAGFYAFLDASYQNTFANAEALKGQITGPLSLSCFLSLEGQPLIYSMNLVREISRYISALACWQIEMLRPMRKPVIVCLDEPGLSFLHEVYQLPHKETYYDLLNGIFDRIRAAGGLAAIHCCCGLSPLFLEMVRPDLLSFDVELNREVMAQSAGLRSQLDSGLQLAFGVIPTKGFPLPDDKTLFDTWLALASSLGDPKEIARRCAITSACGLAGTTVAEARHSFLSASSLSRRIRETVLV